jgi:hypothetical protein
MIRNTIFVSSLTYETVKIKLYWNDGIQVYNITDGWGKPDLRCSVLKSQRFMEISFNGLNDSRLGVICMGKWFSKKSPLLLFISTPHS